MNVLEKLKARLADGRVAELRARIKQMEEEHNKELIYIAHQHAKRVEILTNDNERLRRELCTVAVELGRINETMGRLVSK